MNIKLINYKFYSKKYTIVEKDGREKNMMALVIIYYSKVNI